MSPNSRRSCIYFCLSLTLLIACVAVLTYLPRKVGAGYVTPGPAKSAEPQIPVSTERATQTRLREAYGKLPLSFEANQGQTDGRVKFMSRGPGYSLFLTPTEAVLRLDVAEPKASADARNKASVGRARETKNPGPSVLRLKFPGANPAPQVTGVNELPGKSNYFIGNDAAKWRTNVPSYARVKYLDMYPGVDMVMYGNQRQLEYDFVVAPGADANKIRLAISGAQQIHLDKSGDLLMRTTAGEVRQPKPVIYQEVNDSRKTIEGRYVQKGRNVIAFQIGAYDSTLPLVIDPALIYSTYIGGNGNEQAFGIAVDSQGNAYITGQTGSTDFPVTAGSYDTAPDTGTSSGDAFVTKFNPSGTGLIYSTYLGGVSPFGNSASDTGYAIAVDARGNAYVAGHTFGFFPTTPGAAQTVPPSATDKGFVTKLDPTGSTLVYSSYIGGNNYNFAFAVAIDATDHAYVTGTTGATNFPVTPGAFQTSIGSAGNADVFVVKLNAAGSAYDYATYLGGTIPRTGWASPWTSTGEHTLQARRSRWIFPSPRALTRRRTKVLARSFSRRATFS